MPRKKTGLDRFPDLTWDDIEEWAGAKIVSRGKSYQRRGRVAGLAVTDDGSLIAWVDGTKRYATRVVMGESGLPDSTCTCPYSFDCKHGVAVVLEYLKCLEKNHPVPKAREDDDRLELLADERGDDEYCEDSNAKSENIRQDIDDFLKGKTKAQLIDLIHDLAGQYPEMARDLSDRKQLISGKTKALVTRLRKEIRDIGSEPGWRNYWDGEGYTPDYSGVRKKLGALLKAGHVDEVLTLGRELVTTGIRQVEQSDDEGETSVEISACMPIIVEALDRSSLDAADKLVWALDAVLNDSFEVCRDFADYLCRRHPKTAWHRLADRLLARLDEHKGTRDADDFSRNYERDQLSDWAIHALDRSGRKDEIIPLCIVEAGRTGSYPRLVERLMEARLYEDAEQWIRKGIQTTKDKWPGIASGLRNRLLEIRTREKNWPVVAAIQAEEFVRSPFLKAYRDCKKTCGRIKSWPRVRDLLLHYLAAGELPWKQKSWPLPESGLDRPDGEPRKRFPLTGNLIEIAIFEKNPEQVLRWYDRLSADPFKRCGALENDVAEAVKTHAPDRAVAIWKSKAERLIDQVKPSAYREAAGYLRKVAKVMQQGKKSAEWGSYLKKLREQHLRKRRLIEILDGLDGKPIVKKRR